MRLVTSLPLVHISLVRASDLVATLKEAAAPIRNFYIENPLNATVSFISGPSRMADIEMRPILVVHGPDEIDIPMMISAVKDHYSRLEKHPLVNRAVMAAETMAKMGSATAPMSNWFMNNQFFRSRMEKYVGIDRRRKLPAFRRKTLAKRFDSRGSTLVSNPVHHVAFFADIYANYNAPELGMAAVERLESRGCKVLMPPQQGCGYPYIGYGNLQPARKVAEENVRNLAYYTQQGYDIVSTEPTAVYCLKVSYPKLLNDRQDAVDVANRTYEYFEYLKKLENETPRDIGMHLVGNHFGFHIACHPRALGSGSHAIAFLKKQGADVEVIESGTCCSVWKWPT